MLFTVGAGYFLFVNQNAQIYDSALAARANSIQDRINEYLTVSAFSSGGDLSLSVTNTGGLTANITTILVIAPGGTLSLFDKTRLTTSPGLPIVLNPGQPANGVKTGVGVSSGTYTVKFITQRGSVFTAVYPPALNILAAQALSSGAIGDLYLSFQSYTWYTVSHCSGSSGPYCLTKQNSTKGFQVPTSAFNGFLAFSVTVTDYNPQQANITLNKYSFMEQYWPTGASFRTAVWYAISNTSRTISSSFTPRELFYNKSATLVFASAAPGSFSPTNGIANGGNPPSGTLAAVNLVTHGWEAKSYSAIIGPNPPAPNYGQNSPYVSTLYYP